MACSPLAQEHPLTWGGLSAPTTLHGAAQTACGAPISPAAQQESHGDLILWTRVRAHLR